MSKDLARSVSSGLAGRFARPPVRFAWTAAIAVLLSASSARAEPSADPGVTSNAEDAAPSNAASSNASTSNAAGAAIDAAAEDARLLARPPSSSMRFLASLALGDGMRFNNPYRLQTELGSSARSFSLTRGYVDLGAAFALGAVNGFQHGAALRLSVALGGVAQQVLAPSYFIAYRGPRRAMGYGRLGPSIILSPDPNVGGELAVGGAYFITAGIAASAELVGDLYYGAGTRDTKASVIPVVSAQLGVLIDYEVLP